MVFDRCGERFEGCRLGGVGREGCGEADLRLMRLANEEFRLTSRDCCELSDDVG
jgi:hypothetical protein